jgi:hypothetical protein
MKIPVVYELNGHRLCLLVQDGETISIGRGAACSIRLDGDAVQEVELTAQFVNSCQFVVVHPANGSVSYAQPLPWRLTLGGSALALFRPATAARSAAGSPGRELLFQGLPSGETRLLLTPEQPLLLGSGPECDLVIPDTTCPAMLLALGVAAGGKVLVQVLDTTTVVGWLGRAAETEAELDLPLSLSIGGRVILISTGDAPAVKSQAPLAQPTMPVLAFLPKSPAIQAKNTDAALKIVSRQARPADIQEAAGKTVMQPSAYASSPVPLPRPSVVNPKEDLPLLPEQAMHAPKPYSPTLFLIASWLLVALAFAVALLPGRGILQPEQLLLLWKAAGGMLILTLILGLGVLLK